MRGELEGAWPASDRICRPERLLRRRPASKSNGGIGRIASRHILYVRGPSSGRSASLLCWTAYWRGEIPFTSLNAREK